MFSEHVQKTRFKAIFPFGRNCLGENPKPLQCVGTLWILVGNKRRIRYVLCTTLVQVYEGLDLKGLLVEVFAKIVVRYIFFKYQQLWTILLDQRSINLSGAQEKEGQFHYKNFLRALKLIITCHTCSITPESLY